MNSFFFYKWASTLPIARIISEDARMHLQELILKIAGPFEVETFQLVALHCALLSIYLEKEILIKFSTKLL